MILNPAPVSTLVKNYKDSQNAFLSKEVAISLSQESGISYTSLVKPGDLVKEGEIIAKAGTSPENTTYIHASLPGKVLDIAPCYSPDGGQDFAIKIKFGGSLSYLGKRIEENSEKNLSADQIIKSLIDNGVVNTFKISNVQNLGLQIRQNPAAKNLIIRMFDEDPYRITDSLVTKLHFEKILKASLLLAKAINANAVFFAFDAKIEEKEKYRNAIKELNLSNYYLLELNLKKYPCGTPREIISNFRRSNLKKSVNFDLSKKDLFIDSSSMLDVYEAVLKSTPLITKNVHFFGNCLHSSTLLNVKIGTPLKDIVAQLGGFAKKPALIVINGSICGTSVQSLDVPITKYVKSVEFVSNVKKTNSHVYSCVNCGNCRVACPVKLSPDILYMNTINFKFMPELFAASSIACIDCGLCNTVCPARLPLSQTIALLKNKYTKE